MGEAMRLIAAGEKVYEMAAVSSLNKATRWARTRVIREIAILAKVSPQLLVSKRFKVWRARRGMLFTTMGCFTRPISARKLKGARQTKTGVSAYQHSWPHAFIRRPLRQGFRGVAPEKVFRRFTKKNYKIQYMSIKIQPVAEKLILKWADRASERVMITFPHELEWRLNNAAR
ncbi:MAG: hypothetical protein KJ831_15010 [Candidatus Eisenbacteria bacterium]|nr:hypothetical protein [Candidatus Eisenbacteria bacterium]